MTAVVDHPQRLRDVLPAVFCAVPIAGGLCPELLGACPAHPICGELEPITQSARCLRRPHSSGLHTPDGLDDWADSEERLDEESRHG